MEVLTIRPPSQQTMQSKSNYRRQDTSVKYAFQPAGLSLRIEKHPFKRFHLQDVVLRIFSARRQGENAIFMCCVADNWLCYFCLTCPLFLFSFIVITIMTLCDLSGGIKCGRGTKARFEFWLCAGRQKKTNPDVSFVLVAPTWQPDTANRQCVRWPFLRCSHTPSHGCGGSL